MMNKKVSWDKVIDDVRETMATGKSNQPASFARRILSALIDLMIIYAILNFMGQTAPISEGMIGINANTYGFLVMVGYSAILECSPVQGTAGKIICGLKVTNFAGEKITFLHSIGRTLAKSITAMTLLFGFLTIFFTNSRQSLHDLVSRTLVLRDLN